MLLKMLDHVKVCGQESASKEETSEGGKEAEGIRSDMVRTFFSCTGDVYASNSNKYPDRLPRFGDS